MAQEIHFILGDQLPTCYDVTISIFSVTTVINRPKMNKAILCYSNALIKLWKKTFGRQHVLAKTSVILKIKKLVKHYYNNVISKANRSKPKKKNMATNCGSKRLLNKKWKEMSVSTGHKCFRIDGLMEIGKEMESLGPIQKKFHEDQKNERKLRVSIDLEDERENICVNFDSNCENDESDQSSDDEERDNINNFAVEVNAESNSNRSGLIRIAMTDGSTQTDSGKMINQPEIRKNRVCLSEVKKAIVVLCVNCNLSANMAILAFQIVCEYFYQHKYYLTKDEALEKDPHLIALNGQARIQEPIRKKPRLGNQIEKRVPNLGPKSKEDYLIYRNVLPSSRTINNYKQVLAIQAESDAANALYNIRNNVTCTLHYDTTSRCKIDGEWPAIIFSFSDMQRYILRPLFFAYEDRRQIEALIVETFERLALLVTTKPEGTTVTAKSLWENVNIIMTDSVEKNLHIEEGIASSLHSVHQPYHFLCKSHLVEALDRSNIAVLGELETELKFRQAIESWNPNVKSFLRGEKSVVLCAIKSILSFVSHDKSSTPTNQADLFDYVLQREGKVKHLAMYRERRFTKLGYSCASILDALPFIEMVLNETHLSNQHTDIVRLFIESELVLTELKCLAYFTSKVSLPLLYAVEVSNQNDLCDIFPRLYKDLMNFNLETLNNWYIKYHHVEVSSPGSEIEKEILKKMCTDAAKTVERQCGREYGFGITDVEKKPRATEIYRIPLAEREKINVTNNIIAESHLSVFDRKSQVAKFRNNKFKAKGIRNDLVLHNSAFINSPTHFLKKISAILNEREKNWSEKQALLNKSKIEEKMKKAKKHSNYVYRLLVSCKSWGGPVTTVEELDKILFENSNLREKIVRTELSYYKHMNKSEVIANPSFFKINKISHSERLINFCILLNDNSPTESQNLPDNSDALKILRA